MKKNFAALKTVLAIIALGLVFPPNSYAYLDPGTGTFILQALIAAVVAASLTIKAFWHRIKALFNRLMPKTPPVEK